MAVARIAPGVLGVVLHGPRWLVWLLAAVALGVVALWALVLVNLLVPGVASGSGSGSAAAVR